MTRYCAWMNDLESYSSFCQKTIDQMVYLRGGEIDLSDIGLDLAEVNL